MTKAIIKFNKLVQDSQNYNSFNKDDDFMIAEIHFTLEIKDKLYKNMKVEIRQPYGTNYETEPIEVGKLIGSYHDPDPWNYHDFSELCEIYYRDTIGSSGNGISIKGASQVRMRDNIIERIMVAEMDIPQIGANTW